MPWSTAGLMHAAQELGVDVVLAGAGADEALGSPRYLLPHLTDSARRAWRYTRLVCENGWYGPICEALHLLSLPLPRRYRNLLYMATNYPQMHEVSPKEVLTAPLRQLCEDWEQMHYKALIDHHEATFDDWASADAYDTLFPLELPVSSSSLAIEYPFLTSTFLPSALGLPVHERFSASHATSYHQRKAAVLALIPERIWPALPHQKATFRESIAKQPAPDSDKIRLVFELGIVDRTAYAAPAAEEFRPTVLAIERWLQQALARGHQVAT
ncbi:hypothetical protein UNPF46_11555 [Bradyrhizobium sp. UNPF46]|nr:hypothetical protein UNPF46_11555 [Bradyrhizobium sp. UNPF46]